MSADLKRMLRAVRQSDQIVTPRYEQWLLRGQNLPVPQPIADRVRDLLMTAPRDRTASFSASSSGHCLRAQVYGYLGTESYNVPSAQLMSIFNNGTWVHLRLQAAMLMAGIITDVKHIEFPLYWRRLRTRGTMDGLGFVPDDHPNPAWRGKSFGLELKSANSNVFRKLQSDGPDKYERQFTRYFLMSGVDLFAVFVECKDTQQTLEWVVEPSPALAKLDKLELEDLNYYIDNKKLPPRLPECKALKGDVFRNCTYGGRTGPCALRTTWELAQPGADNDDGDRSSVGG